MSLDEVAKARKFHEIFPQYSLTPLADLKNTADFLGISQVKVKDESYRFGINAFKVLGGSYSIARCIADETWRDVSELPYNVLKSGESGYCVRRLRENSLMDYAGLSNNGIRSS